MDTIQDNVKRLKEDIAAVCTGSGREIKGIRLVAVSKTMDIGKIQQAIDAGLDTFGENYVQEAMEKINAFPSAIHWHFIGNIQKNKVKHIVESFELIHSVGNTDVAVEIDKRAMRKGHVQPVLFEINLAGEATKSGFSPGQFFDALRALRALKHIQPSGLMTMPPPADSVTQLSRYFSDLREMRDRILAQGVFGSAFKELSMGTSTDYKIAIKEGATMIRIGTTIFGPRG
ncbi:MAG: YggS family pyridoxal phosphate-dependent enzyme [Deltaproteobacteria bacterium]|nr:YggS family pyridoxal phosphate-dependent enzyme [Deltaproteobacteria bacterium]MCL5276542.1 YggS family pyridoxal phosphate-dependent enzyme [Deltaproteobacteria bacterium]